MEKYEKFKLSLDMFSGFITEPAIRYFETGTCKCTFAIPLKENKEAEPIWLNCEAWGRVAEKIGEMKKGDKLIVLGNLKEVEYETKTKEKKTTIKFMVEGAL